MLSESIKHGTKAVMPSVNHTMPQWFSRPKFCISGLKIHRQKTNGKRKFKRMLSFLLWTRKASSFTFRFSFWALYDMKLKQFVF